MELQKEIEQKEEKNIQKEMKKICDQTKHMCRLCIQTVDPNSFCEICNNHPSTDL